MILIFLLLIILGTLASVFAQTYYLEIYNPNSYDLIDYQLKINVSQYNIPIPIAKIETLDGTNVPFCYEQPNGECNSTYTNTTEIIWIKLPYVKARWYTHIKIIVNGTNGAVHGDKVFDFYDDFNDGRYDDKWIVFTNGGNNIIEETNGNLHVIRQITGRNQYGGVKQISKIDIVKRIIEARAKYVTDRDHDFILGYADESGDHFVNLMTHNYHNMFTLDYIDKNGNFRRLIIEEDPTLYLGQYLIYRLYVISSNVVTGEVEGLGSRTANDIYPIYSGYIKLFASNGLGVTSGTQEFYVDWVKVRKYIDQNLVIKMVHLSKSRYDECTTDQYRYQFTYLYVIPIRITSNSPIGITNLVIPISLNTKDLIAQGILKSDCSDISVTIYDPSTDTEINAKQYIDLATCNTDNTIIYINIPEYFIGRDIFINVYLGSPSAVPIQDPETFYWFVDLSNPSDYTKIDIFTNGTASYNITTSGMLINIGTGGKLVIYNK